MEKSVIDNLLYWLILVISIIGNFIISIVLVPVLVALEGVPLYFSIFLLSTSFGYFFTFILNSIEKLQPRQNVIAMILIPAIALINVTIITLLSNKLILLLGLKTLFHSPYLIAPLYVGGYVLPQGIKTLFHKALKNKQ